MEYYHQEMKFNLLPNEVTEHILHFLNGDDILEIALLNKHLYKLSNTHNIWCSILEAFAFKHQFCFEQEPYFFKDLQQEELKNYYIKVVKKWGWLIGLWRRQLKRFGGMLQVKVESSCHRIAGYDIQAIGLSINPVPVFVIYFDALSFKTINVNCHDFNQIRCVFYSKNGHYCNIESSENDTHITLTCQDNTSESHDVQSMMNDFRSALGMNHRAIPQAVFSELSHEGVKFSKILKPLESTKDAIIKPGYFAGDYSAHCCEIVSLQLNDSNIFMTKISGDGYVRAGSVSVNIDTTFLLDYLALLGSIIDNPYQFTLKNALSDFQIEDTDQLNSESKIVVPGCMVAMLKAIDSKTFGLTEDNTFIAAFKGQITLGNNPDNEFPTYHHKDIIAVITDDNTVTVYLSYIYTEIEGLGYTDEMLFKRIPIA